MLQSAIISGEYQTVKYLCENVINIHAPIGVPINYLEHAIISERAKIYRYLVSIGAHIDFTRVFVIPYTFTSTDIKSAIDVNNLKALEIIMKTKPDKSLLTMMVRHTITKHNYSCLKFILKRKDITVDWNICMDYAFESKSEQAVLEILHACPLELRFTYDDLLRATELDMKHAADNIRFKLSSK
jgi:hypothetical protein